MEYVVIGILIVLVILVIVLIIKINNKNNSRTINDIQSNLIKQMGDLKFDLSKSLGEDLNKMNELVNKKLTDNNEKTNMTINKVIESLATINEAQKRIDSLQQNIGNLESVLTDKKSRGIFGEVNLTHVLSSIFGEKNDKIFRLQYTLPLGATSDKRIADAIVFAPEPLGNICIDSKFPLEHYRAMMEKDITNEERVLREKAFVIDVKKHIDAIGSKYIVEGITSKDAIMFVPAEAIFAEINAYHPELIDYANSRNVYITSPTTLMAMLTIIESVLKGMERDKYAQVIHEELNKLGEEFNRFKDRWESLTKHIKNLSDDVEKIDTTANKITKRFDEISDVKIEKQIDHKEE